TTTTSRSSSSSGSAAPRSAGRNLTFPRRRFSTIPWKRSRRAAPSQTTTSSLSLAIVARAEGAGHPTVSTRPSTRRGRRKVQSAPSIEPFRFVPGTDCASSACSNAVTACRDRGCAHSREDCPDHVGVRYSEAFERRGHLLPLRVILFGDDNRCLCRTSPEEGLRRLVGRPPCDQDKVDPGQ